MNNAAYSVLWLEHNADSGKGLHFLVRQGRGIFFLFPHADSITYLENKKKSLADLKLYSSFTILL